MTTNAELFETLEQLLNPRQSAQIRAAAATAIAAQSSGSANSALRREIGTTELGKRVLKRLLALTSDNATARLVLTALINIAEDSHANDALVELNVVARTCEVIVDSEQRTFISLHAALLSNVTRTDAGRNALVCDELILARVRTVLQKARYVPNLLWISNLAALPAGRKLLLGEEGIVSPLNELLKVLVDKDPAQRLAVASTLRNCALAEDIHVKLLERTNTLGALLARFVSRTRELDPDEKTSVPALVREAFESNDRLTPEPVDEIRVALAEALLLLCKSEVGRDALRADGAYVILRDHHLDEENPAVKDAIESIVNRTKLVDEESTKPVDVQDEVEITEIGEEVSNVVAVDAIE